jgi:hypothetical protein
MTVHCRLGWTLLGVCGLWLKECRDLEDRWSLFQKGESRSVTRSGKDEWEDVMRRDVTCWSQIRPAWRVVAEQQLQAVSPGGQATSTCQNLPARIICGLVMLGRFFYCAGSGNMKLYRSSKSNKFEA